MPQYAWDAIVNHVARRLSEESGQSVDMAELTQPPKPELGDLAFGCFKIAKAQGKNPNEIATMLASKLASGDHTIQTASVAGPYVNISIKPGEMIHRIVSDVERSDVLFGASDALRGTELMLEYAQPNTHKEIHVGHLRNLLLGNAVTKLLRLAGSKVITASYHGDVGAHVAKCLWLFVREGAALVPQPKSKKTKEKQDAEWVEYVIHNFDLPLATALIEHIPLERRTGERLGKLYAEATKLLEENPEWKSEVSVVQQKLEAHDPAWSRIWQETRRWSLAEMDTIFQEMGVSIDRRYLESEVVDEGQRIVDELLTRGVARESQGAIIVDLEDQKLGVFLIRKSDGTSLYATKDLALAQLKLREHPKLQRSLILVDNRQALYFKQLFATLRLLGISISFEFIGYEFVTLKTGAMSSREGNIVTLESFRDELVAYATTETKQRHPDWPQGRIEHTAWCLATGGLKYGMLKQDSDKVFTFDMQQALSFDGDTGPYIQYAATRLSGILKKGGWQEDRGREAGDLTLLTERAEKQLALQLALFPAICRRAAEELKPTLIAQWCLALSHRITEFYHDVSVLESPFGVREARLRLIAAVRQVLHTGLDILGVPLPDEM